MDMRFEKLIAITRSMPYFDLATIVQLSGEPRQSLCMQLSRLVRQGKIKSLRRGMYALGEPYRKMNPSPALLANRIYSPSYLSFHWALGYYDLIPEMVFQFTSATPRVPRLFKNEFGSFQYRHIKPDFFAGYQTVEIDRHKVLIAVPEKALMDLWHIEDEEWTTERMASMRFQNFELVSLKKLIKYAEMFQSPRLVRAVKNWRAYVKAEMKGVKEL
jgi:predicted transcriptional regulator of viral defense system